MRPFELARAHQKRRALAHAEDDSGTSTPADVHDGDARLDEALSIDFAALDAALGIDLKISITSKRERTGAPHAQGKSGERDVPKRSSMILAIPLPPPIDHPSSAQLAWRKRALAEVEAQRPVGHDILTSHARVRVLIGIVHGRALVELVPMAMTVLADARLISSPSVISDVVARWDKTIEPGRVQIDLAPAVPPLRRIGATARRRIRESTISRWSRAPVLP